MDSVDETATDDGEPQDSLVRGLLHDTVRDSRPCRQPTCHGELVLGADRETVFCDECRCGPDGTYYPPPREDVPDEASDDERPRYDGSERVRLPGGFADPYDETHPAGDGTDYEYDLSTY